MLDALSKDSRIHRDISAGNIILVRDQDSEEKSRRKGYLIDWESSSHVDDAGVAVKPGRAVRVQSSVLCMDDTKWN